MNLRLLQITDSALPIGGYTHSWGLEAAIARGLVHDPETLERWTSRWLRMAFGPLEGVLVAASCRASLERQCRRTACASTSGRSVDRAASTRHASREMGEQLLALGATWAWCARPAVAVHPGQRRRTPMAGTTRSPSVCLGPSPAASRGTCLTAYLHQAALGMIGAGVRAIPVGHTHGQQMLAYLHDDIRELAADLVDRDPATAGAGCPFYEILCDEQTRLYARMFRS